MADERIKTLEELVARVVARLATLATQRDDLSRELEAERERHAALDVETGQDDLPGWGAERGRVVAALRDVVAALGEDGPAEPRGEVEGTA